MKLTSNIGTASSSRATSSAPAYPTQAVDTVTPPQTRSPPGPLAGLSSGPVLRGRRAPLSPRVTAGTTQAESSHGASHRSESSQSSHSSELTDASFHSAQAGPTPSVVDKPQSPAAATTHAQRSASAAAELKAQLRARLVDLPFAAPSEEQEALQAAYLEWADARVQERIAAFGPDAGYQIAGDMKTAGAKAAWPIAYECLRALIIGSMRTPFGLAAGAAYDGARAPGSETLSTTTLSGAVAGLMSYTSDTLLIPAMDRRARVANLPRFQAIDPKILVPDPPPALLEITAEGKRFTRPGEGDAPTLAELKAQTYDLRQGITQWQSTLDDKSLDTLLLKPTINAGFNAARRISDDPGTRTPAGQLGLSALAIGGAGVVQKAMLETGKAVARTGQMRVPDLLGGQQRLNLFSLALPDKTRRPAQWSDAVRFPPNYLLETGKEGLALARQALSTTNAVTTALRDVLGRHMLSNLLANFASLGAGRLIAAPLRGGNANGSVAGEAANSTATVVQQAVQTLFNDTVWNALKAKNGANTTQATRLDQQRAVRAASHQRTIARTLQSLAEPINEAIAMFAPTQAQIARALEEGQPLAPAPGPQAVRLHDALEKLRTEIDTQSVSIATIDTVRDELHAGQAAMFSGVPRNNLTETLDTGLTTLRHALHESEALR
ncbi:type III secretion system effector XopF1 [Xanthomonas arboricola]|uniref:Type III secretion system effector XopF1 n=4 Tax=Xanthomonas arboricola pv. pruni TaxID=69929 RepID=A0AAP4K932_9XANT|nr:type III secretion system effector XopF1 [Xanthomonas arboricola]KPN10580.1 hypothetical protein AN652_10770 [Xanthomonas arboricola pv. pruni]MDN0266033.1 type III secretion system effector XopF1 [Xanthomonas arboricola pv. pruni]MDN0270057.1 type III secretion system effector XopF1 [Xanthomonas arboricola pv. pruni]MDN0274356.1 type III secretion system effector XopF1 [Xanthomonas arboricola pv. pruni]MDN0282772.1 type III secretion system effector XopF1 [Xanthomonas arboricola pv. pruni]